MHTSSNAKILVCTNLRVNPNQPSCGARNSNKLIAILAEKLNIPIEESPCMGLCEDGPNIRIVPHGTCFNQVSTQSINKVIKEIESLIKC